jgi:hypothetical protein
MPVILCHALYVVICRWSGDAVTQQLQVSVTVQRLPKPADVSAEVRHEQSWLLLLDAVCQQSSSDEAELQPLVTLEQAATQQRTIQ